MPQSPHLCAKGIGPSTLVPVLCGYLLSEMDFQSPDMALLYDLVKSFSHRASVSSILGGFKTPPSRLRAL